MKKVLIEQNEITGGGVDDVARNASNCTLKLRLRSLLRHKQVFLKVGLVLFSTLDR